MTHRPAPMTGDTAREIIEQMRRETSIKAQKGLLEFAIGRGNLTVVARALYRERLGELTNAPPMTFPVVYI